MSVVNANSTQSDQLLVSITQTGTNSCDIVLKNDLFAEQSDAWLCGIASLQVPLDSTTYLDDLADPVLFRLKRKIHGANPVTNPDTVNLYTGDATSDIPTAVQGNTADDQMARLWTYTLFAMRKDQQIIREWGDFSEVLNSFGIRVRNAMNFNGLNVTHFTNTLPVVAANAAVDHFGIRITPSGMLSIVASSIFWNNFYIEASEYAQEIFGVGEVIALSKNVVTTVVTLQSSIASMVDVNGAIVNPTQVYGNAAQQSVPHSVDGSRSLWGSLDTRIAVSIATDMPLKRALAITNDSERKPFVLGTFFLDHEVRVTSTVGQQIETKFTVSMQSRSGHVVLKSPATPVAEWVQLGPSSNVRNLRLKLYITERRYRDGKWSIYQRELDVPSYNTWSAKLAFVKRIN